MRNAERKAMDAGRLRHFFISHCISNAWPPYTATWKHSLPLTLELLDAGVVLAGDERKRDDTRDVHLRAEDVHVEAELDADGLDVLETFLVVRTGATDPDLDLVLDDERSDLAESANDTLEGGGDLFRVSAIVCIRFSWNQLTLVKLAIPPPMKRTLPSACMGARSMRSRTVRA
jgi:hypothetical protein